ncbi:MAG TPA: VOC family protein [Puia sp.]|nr:VOC family protein [Puia sp.]
METKFAPELKVKVVAPALEFYQQAFGVEEVRRFSNDDGSIHIVELTLGGTELYVHEQMPGSQGVSPEQVKGTTVELVVFVPDPDAAVDRAVAAGARLLNPTQDHFYGLRQGTVLDPFGHLWTFQKKIGTV